MHRWIHACATIVVALVLGCRPADRALDSRTPIPAAEVLGVTSEVPLQPAADAPIGYIAGVVEWNGVWAIADEYQHDVKLFARDGRLLRTIGRRGDGPGEFQAPASLVVAAGGRLLVLDGAMRVSSFEPDGRFVGAWPMAGIMPGPIALRADSTEILVPARITQDGVARPMGLHRFGLGGAPHGTLASFDDALHPGEGSLLTPSVAMVGDVALVTVMSRNVVTAVPLDGGAPERITVGEGNYVAPRWPDRPLPPPQAMQWMRDFSWITGIVSLGDDAFAVQMHGPATPDGLPARYAIADLHGNHAVLGPTDLRLFSRTGGRMIATRTDAEGNVSLVTLDVRLPWRGER